MNKFRILNRALPKRTTLNQVIVYLPQLPCGRLQSPSPSYNKKFILHPIGLLILGESGNNAIHVARVVVVVRVAVVVDIHKVGRVAEIRRSLPPVPSRKPTAQGRSPATDTTEHVRIITCVISQLF